jgi:hypothetical protein
LGNQFKWAELSRKIPFDPQFDSDAIAEANSRTIEKFGLTPRTNVQDSIIAKASHDNNSAQVEANVFAKEMDYLETESESQAAGPYDIGCLLDV